MQDIRLTPTSYVVLGLLDQAGEATPYELKAMVTAGVGNFWSLQHAQLYSEPERLAGAGYLIERRESGGRRRRRYSVTDRGREALAQWLAEPTHGFTELRDPGLLKLFFGADRGRLAADQLEIHEAKLREYEAIHASAPGDAPTGALLTLEAGIGHAREWIRFWKRVARG